MLSLLLFLALATEVIRYQVPAKLPARTQQGYCWTSSIAAPYRQDAWRCMVGNEIHDPCFATSQKDRAVCDMNPARDEAGFVLQLARPLPEADSPPAANETWAWLIELQDGTICVPFTGTNPLIHGEMAHYGCGESVLLLGALASKGQTWSAKKALVTYGKSGVSMKSQVKVILKRVWQ